MEILFFIPVVFVRCGRVKIENKPAKAEEEKTMKLAAFNKKRPEHSAPTSAEETNIVRGSSCAAEFPPDPVPRNQTGADSLARGRRQRSKRCCQR